MTRHRILIADDHPLFREALKQTLAAIAGKPLIEEAESLAAAIAAIEKAEGYDLILLDLQMPKVQGLAGLAFLRAQYPDIPVTIVSASEEPQMIRRALALGASGYIPKSLPVEIIRRAVTAVLAGEVWLPQGIGPGGASEDEADGLARRLATLTPQQVRVLMMLKEGLLNKQIAHELHVSEATIKVHVSAILLKLGVGSRTQAVIAANRIDGELAHSAQ